MSVKPTLGSKVSLQNIIQILTLPQVTSVLIMVCLTARMILGFWIRGQNAPIRVHSLKLYLTNPQT